MMQASPGFRRQSTVQCCIESLSLYHPSTLPPSKPTIKNGFYISSLKVPALPNLTQPSRTTSTPSHPPSGTESTSSSSTSNITTNVKTPNPVSRKSLTRVTSDPHTSNHKRQTQYDHSIVTGYPYLRSSKRNSTKDLIAASINVLKVVISVFVLRMILRLFWVMHWGLILSDFPRRKYSWICWTRTNWIWGRGSGMDCLKRDRKSVV